MWKQRGGPPVVLCGGLLNGDWVYGFLGERRGRGRSRGPGGGGHGGLRRRKWHVSQRMCHIHRGLLCGQGHKGLAWTVHFACGHGAGRIAAELRAVNGNRSSVFGSGCDCTRGCAECALCNVAL